MEQFTWQVASVTAIRIETPRVKTLTLRLPQWQQHRPGQHYDLRLTAPDGYQAQRSYSVASPPEQSGEIELTVELVANGEISAYLHDAVAVGDALEVRGPIGGYFTWGAELAREPLLLIAGGSGIVPLMAMLRHRAALGATNPTTLLFSVRSAEEAIYYPELAQLAQPAAARVDLRMTFTRQPPPGWTGYQRRIDEDMLREVLGRFAQAPHCYVCGPASMVEAVANTLVDVGVPAAVIRTERFG